jgi:RNA polymerase sigma-70 factor (ECF subfamily)
VNANAAAAFDALVARHEREVLAVCRSILHDEGRSRDAAQETFLRLWTRLAEQRGPARPAGWLRKVALSVALDLVRRGARDAPATDAEVAHALLAPAADEAAAAAELERRYAAALEKLSEGQRTVFLLRHEGGLALAAVAETLGVALPTVKTQFARACVRLQARLRSFRPDGDERR